MFSSCRHLDVIDLEPFNIHIHFNFTNAFCGRIFAEQFNNNLPYALVAGFESEMPIFLNKISPIIILVLLPLFYPAPVSCLETIGTMNAPIQEHVVGRASFLTAVHEHNQGNSYYYSQLFDWA